MKKSRGFTLIELMIVVAIIGVLAAIAIPKFADLIRKGNEGATKGNLGSIRSACAIYYGDNETFPVGSITELTAINGKYLTTIPSHHAAGHHPKATNVLAPATAVSESIGWGYCNVPAGGTSGVGYGDVWVNCQHTDTKGTSWSNW